MTVRGLVRLLTATILLVGFSACSQPEGGGESAAQPAPEPGSVQQPELLLPVSLNTLMVALVNHAADPIWVAAWRNPETDRDWRELERMAIQLEVGGALLSIPGTGPNDSEWASNPTWQSWAVALQQTGADAVLAVRARDLDGVARVGDAIVEICEGCHIDFKPDLPTGGQFGELSPTAADFDEGEKP